jgi:hypothetical protein
MQHSDSFIEGTEYEARFKTGAERERLLSNLVALRQNLWEMRANLAQLERVLEESRSIHAEAECLREQIHMTVEKIGPHLLLVRES